MKILRETKDMTTEEFAQYKGDRAQASKEASKAKAREKGNVTEAKVEETESERRTRGRRGRESR